MEVGHALRLEAAVQAGHPGQDGLPFPPRVSDIYSVMQSDRNSVCDYVFLETVYMVFRDDDRILGNEKLICSYFHYYYRNVYDYTRNAHNIYINKSSTKAQFLVVPCCRV